MAPRPKAIAIAIAIAIVSCIQRALPTNTHANVCLRTPIYTRAQCICIYGQAARECNAFFLHYFRFIAKVLLSSLCQAIICECMYINTYIHMCICVWTQLTAYIGVVYVCCFCCCFYCYLHGCDTGLHCVGASESHNN